MLQHIAARWPNARNMLRPTMLRYVVMHVAIVWPGLNVLNLPLRPYAYQMNSADIEMLRNEIRNYSRPRKLQAFSLPEPRPEESMEGEE